MAENNIQGLYISEKRLLGSCYLLQIVTATELSRKSLA